MPGGQACYILSVVLVLVHLLLIPVNPLHTSPSGFLSVYDIGGMKVVILKRSLLQSDLQITLSIQGSNPLSHFIRLYLLPLDP